MPGVDTLASSLRPLFAHVDVPVGDGGLVGQTDASELLGENKQSDFALLDIALLTQGESPGLQSAAVGFLKDRIVSAAEEKNDADLLSDDRFVDRTPEVVRMKAIR